MSTKPDTDTDTDTEFDPHEHVPDEIDIITADGIEQVHEHLSDENAAKYAAEPVSFQAGFLWEMVEKGTIGLDLTGGR